MFDRGRAGGIGGFFLNESHRNAVSSRGHLVGCSPSENVDCYTIQGNVARRRCPDVHASLHLKVRSDAHIVDLDGRPLSTCVVITRITEPERSGGCSRISTGKDGAAVQGEGD